jgi:hypothetical protein
MGQVMRLNFSKIPEQIRTSCDGCPYAVPVSEADGRFPRVRSLAPASLLERVALDCALGLEALAVAKHPRPTQLAIDVDAQLEPVADYDARNRDSGALRLQEAPQGAIDHWCGYRCRRTGVQECRDA